MGFRNYLLIFSIISLVFSVIMLASVSAQVDIGVTDNEVQGVQISAPEVAATGGGNSSFNESLTDLLYLKLDASNDPVTDSLNIQGGNGRIISTNAGGALRVDTSGGAGAGYISFGNTADIGISTDGVELNNWDSDGALVFKQKASNPDGDIEFVFIEEGGDFRFAMPSSGADFGTYNPRSMIIAGPSLNNDTAIRCSRWFKNLSCDTSGGGADLGIQNNLEIGNTTYAKDTIYAENGIVVPVHNTLKGIDFSEAYSISAVPFTGNLVFIGGATSNGTVVMNPNLLQQANVTMTGVFGRYIFLGTTNKLERVDANTMKITGGNWEVDTRLNFTTGDIRLGDLKTLAFGSDGDLLWFYNTALATNRVQSIGGGTPWEFANPLWINDGYSIGFGTRPQSTTPMKNITTEGDDWVFTSNATTKFDVTNLTYNGAEVCTSANGICPVTSDNPDFTNLTVSGNLTVGEITKTFRLNVTNGIQLFGENLTIDYGHGSRITFKGLSPSADGHIYQPQSNILRFDSSVMQFFSTTTTFGRGTTASAQIGLDVGTNDTFLTWYGTFNMWDLGQTISSGDPVALGGFDTLLYESFPSNPPLLNLNRFNKTWSFDLSGNVQEYVAYYNFTTENGYRIDSPHTTIKNNVTVENEITSEVNRVEDVLIFNSKSSPDITFEEGMVFYSASINKLCYHNGTAFYQVDGLNSTACAI